MTECNCPPTATPACTGGCPGGGETFAATCNNAVQKPVTTFLTEYEIEETALDRVIQTSFRLLNRISFFTVIGDEVKAWPIARGTLALDAAGTVHSDIQKGFIRAEVLSFDDLQKYGSFPEAKKAGQVKLEGKEYLVRDGDIINFRFNI